MTEEKEQIKAPNVTPKYTPAENTELIGGTDNGLNLFADEFRLKADSRISIDEQTDQEIKEQAHWLANKFSARNGYTSTEELLLEMGQFVKNLMLDNYNL